MKNLLINEQFQKLISPLTTEEFKQLEINCMAEGIRESILTWNGFIIDGHNRYQISQKWDLDFKTESKSFKDEDEVREWMILNQFGRRNLNNYQRSDLALKLEQLYSAKAKDKQKGGQGGVLLPLISAEAKPLETRKELAKVARVGHDTISKVKHIQAKANEETKAKLSSGEVSINQVYQEIKKEEKKQNFEFKKAEFEKPIYQANTRQVILHGNSIEVLPTLQKNSFDLLLSDPPYGIDFKSGWNDKSKIENDKIDDTVELFSKVLQKAVPLLKDDAHFYLFGSIDYIQDIRPLIEKYLNLKNILIWDRKVIGMGDLKTYGKSFDIIYFGYNKVWKDLNGTRDRDLLSFNRVDPAKNIHPTEKPVDLLEYLIKKSTIQNDKILEPFAGGGSTLLACKNTNRQATGIEIEQKYVDLIETRI